jgi:hypothetical protein
VCCGRVWNNDVMTGKLPPNYLKDHGCLDRSGVTGGEASFALKVASCMGSNQPRAHDSPHQTALMTLQTARRAGPLGPERYSRARNLGEGHSPTRNGS